MPVKAMLTVKACVWVSLIVAVTVANPAASAIVETMSYEGGMVNELIDRHDQRAFR